MKKGATYKDHKSGWKLLLKTVGRREFKKRMLHCNDGDRTGRGAKTGNW